MNQINGTKKSSKSLFCNWLLIFATKHNKKQSSSCRLLIEWVSWQEGNHQGGFYSISEENKLCKEVHFCIQGIHMASILLVCSSNSIVHVCIASIVVRVAVRVMWQWRCSQQWWDGLEVLVVVAPKIRWVTKYVRQK